MDNYKLLLAYEGTDFLGWQDAGNPRSIEAVLRKAIESVLHTPLKLQAASRTDRGVHAEGQVVNFFATTSLPPHRLRAAINAHLPPAIRCLDVEIADPAFHPTLDAKSKIYRYFLYCDGVLPPHLYRTCWHLSHPLNLEIMREGAALLTKEQSFKALANHSKEPKESLRRVNRIDLIQRHDGQLCIEVEGPSFLYKMVRNIVGTLAYLGCGKLTIEEIVEGLRLEERSLLGVTAPAHALFLHKVLY